MRYVHFSLNLNDHTIILCHAMKFQIKNQKAQEELEEQEQQDVDLNQLPAERKLFEGAR